MTDAVDDEVKNQQARRCLIVGELPDDVVAAIEAAEYGVGPD
jgi:hypothetical protein